MKEINEDAQPRVAKPKIAPKSKKVALKKPNEPKSEGIPGFLSAESMALIDHALKYGNPVKVPKGQTYEEFLKWMDSMKK